MKIIEKIIEIVSWFLIFISPIILFCIIGFIVFIKNNKLLFLSIILLVIGLIIGFLFAEYIRKKQGCSFFLGFLRGNPEFDDKEKK